MKTKTCEECPMRAKYDKKTKSLIGQVVEMAYQLLPGLEEIFQFFKRTGKKGYLGKIPIE
jgi:hypothetical protein